MPEASNYFAGCLNIETIDIADSVVRIGTNVFEACSVLETETIGGFVVCDGWVLRLDGAESVPPNLVIPDGVRGIAAGAFKGQYEIETVVFPSTLRFIGAGAFKGCTGIEDITLPDGVVAVDRDAFRNCTFAQGLSLPTTLEEIGAGAFANCTLLRVVALPDGMTDIGEYAFSNCWRITSVAIPASVTNVGAAAFSGCRYVQSLSMPGDVATVASMFSGAQGMLASAAIVGGNVMASLFEGCAALESVAMHAGVTEIGAWAFAGCASLGEIVMPEGVVSVGAGVFDGCSLLRSVRFVGDHAPVCGVAAYGGTDAALVTYVPRGSMGWDGIATSKSLPEFWPDGSGRMIDWWEPNRFDVAFVASDAEGGFATSIVGQVAGTLYELPPDAMRHGARFEGWWTAEEGGERVTSVSQVDIATAHTLYAHWKFNEYNVVFNANGGEGEMDGLEMVVATGEMLPECGFRRPGWRFMGWATEPEGEVVYADAGEVVDLAYEQGATVTLYAVWEEHSWTLEEALCRGEAVQYGVKLITSDDWLVDLLNGRDARSPSVRSGGIGAAEEDERTGTTLTTTVFGEGSGSFWWKVHCEEMDEEYDEWYDYAVFSVDGEEVARIAGDSGWQKVEYEVTVNRLHELSWTFTRDDWDEPDAEWENALWLDEFAWTKVLTLGDVASVDEACAMLPWTTGGDAEWTINETTGFEDGNSAKSGVVENWQSSWIEVSVNGPGTAAFMWNVQGGSYRGSPYAYAKVEVDGVQQAQEYNTEGWKAESLAIKGEGSHTIRWTYLRTSARSADGDCAWLDGFSWTPPCGHPVTNVVNALEATCTEAGYTGDKVCAECGEVIEAGAAIPALGHTEGESAINARAATCTGAGYTGDKVCAECGEIIETGSQIPALGHTEGAGFVTKAPTTTKEGEMTYYYCVRCRAELRTEAIAKLIPLEIHNVVAKQRYPWNGKVDITYEAVGDFDYYQLVLSVSATNRTEGVRYVADASALSGDVGMEAGVHHVVWDMNAQGLDFESDDVVFTVAYDEVPMQYCVVDLSGGADAMNYPVAYLADAPAGGWSDEYKTTKLVLRVIAPDSPGVGDSSDATLTNPYCIGVFEVTQKQYELVTGVNPSSCRGDMRPVENLSWNTIRGDSDVYNWPATSTVDSSSFMGRIQARTGLCFDLPTEAQWEYACRAGTTSAYNNGGDSEEDLKLLGRYSRNKDDGKGGFSEHTTVGSYLPNAWGLYDMHGNAEEWCLDWARESLSRTMRGGSWDYPSFVCTSAFRNTRDPSAANDYNASGFRLAMTMPDPDDATETGPWHKDAHCTADSAVVAIDLRTERIAESIDISWDASWIGGDAGATVVIADNGDEIKATTGAGMFTYSPTGLMRHELTYTTFIDGVAQDDVYRAVLLTSKLACCHSTTNVVGALAATCTETGYTGDKVCKVCGEVLESGSMIPALGHLEGDGVVTKEPTATEEGVVTYYCVRCGDVCRTEVFGEWTDPSTGYKWSYRGVGGGGVEICPAELELLDLGSMGGSGVVASSCVPTVSPWPDGHVDIPSTIAAKPVIGIGRYAFCRMGGHIGTGKFTSVTIPRGVASVGDQAFSGCGDLQCVSIPDTVTSIGDSVFVGCYALTEISVDEGNSEYKSVNGMLLTKDGSRLLQAVNGAEAIPDGVMTVDGGAFSGLDIRHLSIPASVTSIGQDMLIGCANLEGISVAAENTQYKSESGLLLTKDGKTLLQGVNGDIEVPNGVVNIADSSFFGLEGLTRITIAPGVTNIGRAVFFGCYGLTSVTIPNSVSTIGETAFEGCSPEMTVYVAVGDTDRIRGLIERSSYGGSVDFNFVEVDVYWTKIPSVLGDPDAVVTGDAESGFTVTPSVASGAVEVTIPSGVDAAKVTVEVAPTVESVKANGAAIKIVKGGHDITELLDIPAANVSGVVDMTKAAVKDAIVKEAIDKTSGAEIDLKASDPSIKTAPTRRGLTYTFSEGTTLEGMTQKAEKQGDGEPWTPTISVKGGASGFYSIGVGK